MCPPFRLFPAVFRISILQVSIISSRSPGINRLYEEKRPASAGIPVAESEIPPRRDEIKNVPASYKQNVINNMETYTFNKKCLYFVVLDSIHMGLDPYGHHINLTSFKTNMTLKFVIILQNSIKAYHGKSGISKM